MIDEDEILEKADRLNEALYGRKETVCVGRTFEEGVLCALFWVLEDSEDHEDDEMMIEKCIGKKGRKK